MVFTESCRYRGGRARQNHSSGHSKTIQPFETGVITAIHLQDGQVVKQGEVSNSTPLKTAPTVIGLPVISSRSGRGGLGYITNSREVYLHRKPDDADPGFVLLQQQLLRDQVAEYSARVDAAQHLIGPESSRGCH